MEKNEKTLRREVNEIIPSMICFSQKFSRTRRSYQMGCSGTRILLFGESPGKDEISRVMPLSGLSGMIVCSLFAMIRNTCDCTDPAIANFLDGLCVRRSFIMNVAPGQLPVGRSGERKTAEGLTRKQRIRYAKCLVRRLALCNAVKIINDGSAPFLVLCFGRLAWDVRVVLENELRSECRAIILMRHPSFRAISRDLLVEYAGKIADVVVALISCKISGVFDLTHFNKRRDVAQLRYEDVYEKKMFIS